MPELLTNNLVLQEKIQELKKKKNAVILAHYYQEPGVQEVADFVGDSLGLSQQAAKTEADIIVFAGVHFMAETAKILNPTKKVLLPDINAGCSLAESCPPAEFKKFLKEHPGHAVVSYINCSAEIKALSDIICTSSNALQVINSIPEDKPIIFAPDKNLGAYLVKKTGRDLVFWNGACEVHEAFSLAKLLKLTKLYPEAKLLAHPESDALVLEVADFTGSTAAMLEYVKESNAAQFIIATEAGILHQMKKAAPGKMFIPAPVMANNTCACSECPYMKMSTLEKLYDCLKAESPEISLDETLRRKALTPITEMLKLSAKTRSN
jgi:quinolinate synthase